MTINRRAGLALSMALFACGAFGGAPAAAQASQSPEVVRLWPGKAPGTEDWSGKEQMRSLHVPDAGRVVQVIDNVTVPTLTVVRPPPGRATGAGMVILPGGGFMALAWDLEGLEVARWLTDRGVTAFILKYRVHGVDPASLPPGLASGKRDATTFDAFVKALEPRRTIAVADAMQAVRLVRADAREYGVSPDRIGMMGFSAGAMTTMGAVLEADPAARPNFAAPIYGAMYDKAPPKDGPPLFIVHAQDDRGVPASKSLEIFTAWEKAGIPAELHVYPSGGHGFGLGKPNTATMAWPAAFEAWLRTQKAIGGPSAAAN